MCGACCCALRRFGTTGPPRLSAFSKCAKAELEDNVTPAIVTSVSARAEGSINATDDARKVFGRFATEEVGMTYTISTASGGSGKRMKELIVINAGT